MKDRFLDAPAPVRDWLQMRSIYETKYPLRRTWDADFGPLWLVPSEDAVHHTAESKWHDDAPPSLVEWIGTIEFVPKQLVAVVLPCLDYDMRENGKEHWAYMKRATGETNDHKVDVLAAWLAHKSKPLLGEGWTPRRKPHSILTVDCDAKLRKQFTHIKHHAAAMYESAHQRIAAAHQTPADQFDFCIDWVEISADMNSLVVHAISHDPSGAYSNSYIAIELKDDLRWEPISYA